jgi:hypothetical protein
MRSIYKVTFILKSGEIMLSYLKNNKLKNAALLLLTGIAVGCNFQETKIELSDILTETAIVQSLDHVAKDDGSDAMLMASMMGGSMTDSYIVGEICSSPEHYNIVLRTKDKEICIDDSTAFKQLTTGDTVIIDYRYLVQYTYKDTNGDGKKEAISAKPKGYQIISIKPYTPN